MASNQALNALGHAVSGSVGTAVSTAALYPLDLVTTRLKAQPDSDAGYDGVVAAFLIAAWSKATATAITYPFQKGKTRLQMASYSTDKKASDEEKGVEGEENPVPKRWKFAELLDQTIFGVILRIIKEEGPRALYAGVQGELLKSFFGHGLTMLSKGVIHRLVIRLWFLILPHLPRRRLQPK